jgi:hypothetical protein
MLSAYSFWEERGLYRATPAVTLGLGFCNYYYKVTITSNDQSYNEPGSYAYTPLDIPEVGSGVLVE